MVKVLLLFCSLAFRLENRTLSALKLEELACLPQVEPTSLVTDAVAGANVSLRCSVFGLPSASVSWWHSNRLVANGSDLQHAWEDQYYSIAEYRTNDHQVRTSLVIQDLGNTSQDPKQSQQEAKFAAIVCCLFLVKGSMGLKISRHSIVYPHDAEAGEASAASRDK